MSLKGGAGIGEAIASAIARCDATRMRCTHTRRVIQHSRWLITSSRAILDRPGAPVRGGTDPLPADSIIQARLRTLIADGRLPRTVPLKLWAGPSQGGHSCTGCGVVIASGEIEFELTVAPGPLYFHRHCVELWTLEAQNDGLAAS
jgi:hypothetical protein